MRKKILLVILLVCPIMNFFSYEECDQEALYFDRILHERMDSKNSINE